MHTPSDNHSIIYVRVAPDDKKRLRALADSQFDGSMAACIRHLIEAHIGPARRGHEPRVGPPAPMSRAAEGFLDED